MLDAAQSNDYRLRVDGAVATVELTLGDLEAMPRAGGAIAHRLRRGLEQVGAVERRAGAGPAHRHGRARRSRRRGRRALARAGPLRAVDAESPHAADPDTLLALELNGERLTLDHGYPVRLIGPNRPGVIQTKWVTELVVR